MPKEKKNFGVGEQRERFFKACKIMRGFKQPVSILAIDPGRKRCGWANYNQQIRFGTIVPPKEKELTTFGKVEYVADQIDLLLVKYKPSVVFMEDYAYGESVNREVMGETCGVIMDRIFRRRLHLFKISILTVKAFIGAREKSHIMKEVLRKWQLDTETDDEADAIVMCMIGKAMIDTSYTVLLTPGLKNDYLFQRKYKSICKRVGITQDQGKNVYNLLWRKGCYSWLQR